MTKEDKQAALVHLAEWFPANLRAGEAPAAPTVQGRHRRRHSARCPAVERRVLSVVLSVYARRVMYLQSLVAGAARVDLDGKAAGEVTARDAEYAAAKLAEILASREARRAAAVESKSAVRVTKPAAAAAPPVAKVLSLKKRPVLHLPAFRQKYG